MANIIKYAKMLMRKGLKADLNTLDEAEIGLATDTKEVFVGTGTGNVQLAKQDTVGSLGDLGTNPQSISKTVVDRGFNIKDFGVRGDGTTDDTTPINNAIDWAYTQNRKIKFDFPAGTYKYSGSKIIDATKVCFEAKGTVTLDVTGSVSADLPYVFNFQNTRVDSNEINWTKPVFQGFNFKTTLDKATLLTKSTVLFSFETPHQYAAVGDGSKNSAQMVFKNITGRWIPYFYTFGQSAYLLRFENVNHRLCRSVIKIFHPSADPGVINKTLNKENRYHSDYGENISFVGGMIGGSWETTIYNKLQAGSLNFEDISVDYWTGGTFLTVGHNGKTNFSKGHIESAHNPSVSMNPYNLDAPSVKWWIDVQGSHKVNFFGTTFYGATVSDRDTTDLQKLVSGGANNQVNFFGASFENMKFTERQIANIDNCNLINCTFIDSIPFFKTLSTLNNNLVFNKKNDEITDIKSLDNIFCPYYASAGMPNLTDQYTNTSIKVEWDTTEKAFKVTKLGTAVSQLAAFSFNTPNDQRNNLIYTFDVKANGTTTGNYIVKLRGGDVTKRYAMDNTTLKSYYEYTDVQYIRDLVTTTTVPAAYTTYTLTGINSYIQKVQRYKKYVIEIDVNGLAVGDSLFVKNIIVQAV